MVNLTAPNEVNRALRAWLQTAPQAENHEVEV